MDKYEPNMKNPSAYIFDIDGTLAERRDRGPFDLMKVKNDTVKEGVRAMLDMIRLAGHKIIIFTGRDGCCKQLTKEWLDDNGVIYNHFAMRAEGDVRKDSIIKKELFDRIKDKYAVLGVFDDRDQVIKMWRSLGLTCFQVDYGNF